MDTLPSPPTGELAELSLPELRRLLEVALPLPPQSHELKIAWSLFRRAKRQQARRSHYRRRTKRAWHPPPAAQARSP
jgi:hypothetical protein